MSNYWKPDDPSTRGYKAIVAACRQGPFAEKVNVGSIFDNTKDGKAQGFIRGGAAALPAADKINLDLDQADFALSPYGRNSMVAGGSQVYKFKLETNQQKVDVVNDLKWRLGRSLAMAGDDLGLHGLVYKWEISSGVDTDVASPAGAIGYTSALLITLTFDVPRRNMVL